MDPEVLYSRDYASRPEPVWRQLRDEHPVFHDTVGKMWLLTRYADVAAVFADHATYSAATYEESTGAVLGPTLISMDDHGHVVRRSIVAPAFVGKKLATYRPLISDAAAALIDRFEARGSADLVREFTARLPVDVIAAMLGMSGDGDVFRQWVTDMIRGLNPEPALRERGHEAHAEFCAHIAGALPGADDPARHDLIARIARGEADGQRLTDTEIKAFCGLLFIAGGETTDKAMSSMWWNLLRRPEQYDEVKADRELWHAAFSETMRRTAPVVSEDRFTTAPVEWYGTEIPAGARVRVSIGAANLDETVFADPEAFDIHRADLHLALERRAGGGEGERSGHLGFGLGKHFCLGYELARTEAVIGSNMLLDRLGDIRMRPGSDPHPVVARSFQALPELAIEFSGTVVAS